MKHSSFSSWSWPRRLTVLAGTVLPCALIWVLIGVNSWRPRTLLKTGGIGDMAYSPTEPLLACTTWDKKAVTGEIQMWDMQRKTLLWHKDDPDADNKLVFSQNGKMMASAGTKVVLWDVYSGRRLRALQVAVDATYWDGDPFQFSPDGKTILVGTSLFEVSSGRPLRSLGLPSYFDISSDRILKKPPFSGRFREAETIKVSPDQKSALRVLYVLENYKNKPRDRPARYSLGGSRETIIYEYQLWLCDSKGNLISQLHSDKKKFICDNASFSPDGRWLTTSFPHAGHLELQMWDAHTGKLYHRFTDARWNKPYQVATPQISHAGHRLFTMIPMQYKPGGSYNMTFVEWNINSGQVVRVIKPEENPNSYNSLFSVSADDSALALATVSRGAPSGGHNFYYSDIKLWRLE